MISSLVSVIIVNYNYGRFLKEAIDSTLQQRHNNIEVIVVDDGSTDNSRRVIADFDNTVLPVPKENEGQASAFNAGLQASSGQFILLSGRKSGCVGVDLTIRGSLVV